MSHYQVCPKCKGQGHVAKPPWVPGDATTWTDSGTGNYICNVCDGQKVLLVPDSFTSVGESYRFPFTNT